MSEQKHTAGPWFTKREGFSTVYVEARLRQGVIQEVAACGPTEAGQDQQEANARLIAAAPELLSALLGLLLAYNDPGNTGSTHDDKVDMARAAIAKATS